MMMLFDLETTPKNYKVPVRIQSAAFLPQAKGGSCTEGLSHHSPISDVFLASSWSLVVLVVSWCVAGRRWMRDESDSRVLPQLKRVTQPGGGRQYNPTHEQSSAIPKGNRSKRLDSISSSRLIFNT